MIIDFREKKPIQEPIKIKIMAVDAVKSMLNFDPLNWYSNSSPEAMGKVKRIVTSARRFGCTAPSLEELYHNLMEKYITIF